MSLLDIGGDGEGLWA